MTAAARFDRWMVSHPLAYGTLLLVTTVVVLVLFVDLPLAVYLRASGFAVLRPALDTIGELGRAEGWVFGALLVYALSLRYRRCSAAADWWCWLGRHCLLLLASLAATGAVLHSLKALIGRSRPELFFTEQVYAFGRIAEGRPWDSMPSGHTQVAFAVAAVLTLILPSLRLPIFVTAGLVALSRLVSGAHYLSDVLISICLCLAIVRFLARSLLEPRKQWLDRPPWTWWQDWSAAYGGWWLRVRQVRPFGFRLLVRVAEPLNGDSRRSE